MTIDNEPELQLDLEPLENETKQDDIIVTEVKEPEKEPFSGPQAELTVEDGINELKARLEEERKARENAERRANEATERFAAAQNDVNDTNLKLYENAIDTVKRNTDILKQNLRDALSVGDYDAAADIQLTMTKTELDLRDLVKGKMQAEQAAKTPVRPAYASNDPVEAFASQLTRESAEWIRAHPEYAKDETLKADMIDAHNSAVRRGIKADTPEYFQYVERKLDIQPARLREPEPSAMSEASAPTQRRSAPPAAPVSRSGSSGSTNPNSNVVRLTAIERETARDLGMTDREYALSKQALLREGKIAG
jgi:hypothetical protein